MTRGIVVWIMLMGLVSLEVCRWRVGIPLVIVWVLLGGLGGLLWVLILKICADEHHADDTWQGSATQDQDNGEGPHNHFSWHSKTDLSEYVVRREC
jgi:hypothetical protein